MSPKQRNWYYATSAAMVVFVLLALWGMRYDPTGDRFPRWVTNLILLCFALNTVVWSYLGAKWIRDKSS